MDNTLGFYDYLRREYNQGLVNDIKLYKQYTSSLKKREIQRIFLLQRPERPLVLLFTVKSRVTLVKIGTRGFSGSPILNLK